MRSWIGSTRIAPVAGCIRPPVVNRLWILSRPARRMLFLRSSGFREPTASCRLMPMLIDISRITSLNMHLMCERAAAIRSRPALRPILRARYRKQLHATVRTVTHVTERSVAYLTLGEYGKYKPASRPERSIHDFRFWSSADIRLDLHDVGLRGLSGHQRCIGQHGPNRTGSEPHSGAAPAPIRACLTKATD